MKSLLNKKLFLLTFAFLFFVACSDSSSDASSEWNFGTDFVAEDMLLILSAGVGVTLGTDDASAKVNERPRMKVVLDYDFAIGKHEVTCGEFNDLMKKETLSSLKLDCEDEQVPAANVTYYDAVLVANARSKAETMDTAYVYKSAVFDADGHCVNLEGFAFLPGVDAYRLPTEAEWVLVAQKNWMPEEGWNSSNSDYRPHQVCSARADSSEKLSVCDMAGNVMEWVNDWLGKFKDTTLTNYVGAPDGGGLGERVVKGGSFRNEATSMTIYGRGDVYTVTSSTKADYVGFRLAFGKIPNAVWMGSNGTASASRLVSLASTNQIRSVTGTIRTKLAFRNDVSGNIAFVDYANGGLSIREIQDTLDAYHPEISPDGKWVAFCTGLEGTSGTSSVYVRELNERGAGLVKLDVESAAIPRWRVLASGDTVVVYVNSAGNNKNEADFQKGSTWQVSFANGKFGKPQKLFDGAFHGGISGDDRLAVTGARLLRARIADQKSTVSQSAKDTVWYDSEQACNASLSRDPSKRTLFLDFGGKMGRTFAKSDYGTHEMLLIADSVGNLVQGIPAPGGFSFDHSEWSVGNTSIFDNDAGLVVATLTNSNGAHTKIVLLNVADSSIIELVDGDELWHPCLWVKSDPSDVDEVMLDLDSAGIYYTDQTLYYALELRLKMERFWKERDSITTVILGSSRAMFGVYDKGIKSEHALNMAFSSGDLYGMRFLMKNYVKNHLSKLKNIVLEISPDFFIVSESWSWGPVYKDVPGYKYDENHGFWKDGVPDNFVEAVQESPKPLEVLTLPYEPGEFLLPSNSWGSATVIRDSSIVDLKQGSGRENLDILVDLIDEAKDAGINVICMTTPLNPGYKKTGAYSIYGTRRSVAQEIFDLIKEKKVVFFDENKMSDHDYSNDMAYNTDHLSRKGALQLTARLDSLLKTLSK